MQFLSWKKSEIVLHIDKSLKDENSMAKNLYLVLDNGTILLYDINTQSYIKLILAKSLTAYNFTISPILPLGFPSLCLSIYHETYIQHVLWLCFAWGRVLVSRNAPAFVLGVPPNIQEHGMAFILNEGWQDGLMSSLISKDPSIGLPFKMYSLSMHSGRIAYKKTKTILFHFNSVEKNDTHLNIIHINISHGVYNVFTNSYLIYFEIILKTNQMTKTSIPYCGLQICDFLGKQFVSKNTTAVISPLVVGDDPFSFGSTIYYKKILPPPSKSRDIIKPNISSGNIVSLMGTTYINHNGDRQNIRLEIFPAKSLIYGHLFRVFNVNIFQSRHRLDKRFICYIINKSLVDVKYTVIVMDSLILGLGGPTTKMVAASSLEDVDINFISDYIIYGLPELSSSIIWSPSPHLLMQQLSKESVKFLSCHHVKNLAIVEIGNRQQLSLKIVHLNHFSSIF